MQQSRFLLLSIGVVVAPICAEIYTGHVVEAQYGVGVDSVKVMLRGRMEYTYTDSTGRFSLELKPSSLRSQDRHSEMGSGMRLEVGSELHWNPGLRTMTWSAGDFPISLIVVNAQGRVECRKIFSRKEAGQYRLTELEAGFHFARVTVGERIHKWQWFERGTNTGMGDVAEADRGKNDLGKRSTSQAMTSTSGDTLVFEKKGFATLLQSGDEVNEVVKMQRLPIRILIVDGMNNHDWRQTTRIVKAIYARAGFFQVDVSTAPSQASSAAWQTWQPRFSDYEVVVINYNSGDAAGSLRWPRDKEMQLQDFVKAGGGMYALHAANNAFSDWSEYNQMIATGWRPKNFGIALEIYQYARGPAENCEVLSYAFDGPASGNSQRNWPIELMVSYGKGQVYNSTMGHVWAGESMPNAVRDVAFQTALIRASEWLARREVLYPLPKPFNDATRVVYQDLDLQ